MPLAGGCEVGTCHSYNYIGLGEHTPHILTHRIRRWASRDELAGDVVGVSSFPPGRWFEQDESDAVLHSTVEM